MWIFQLLIVQIVHVEISIFCARRLVTPLHRILSNHSRIFPDGFLAANILCTVQRDMPIRHTNVDQSAAICSNAASLLCFGYLPRLIPPIAVPEILPSMYASFTQV